MKFFRTRAKQLEPCLTGSALGLFAGDALGAPVEGLDHRSLVERGRWVSEMEGGEGRSEAGTYTDDTQLMIGQLEALAEDDTLPSGLLARNYAANYEPRRGYGSSTGEALERLGRGELEAEDLSRPSFGNGGAMGIAPLGVYFSIQMKLVCERANAACRITHHHPEAVSGAVAVACCSALLARRAMNGQEPCYGEIISSLRTLQEWKELPRQDPMSWPMADPLATLSRMAVLTDMEPTKRSALLAKTFRGSLRAIESVPIAIAAAASAASLREAVEVAVNAGGDTDSQGAMAGGMAGAYFGPRALPDSWLEAMENRDKGRDYVKRLTRKLAGRALKRHPRF